MILVTGFGPFRDVEDNPAERLARALHRRKIGDHRVMGLVLPVSYRMAPALTLAAAEVTRPVAVIGFGVAKRDGIEVESQGVSTRSGEDVEGRTPESGGPDVVEATADVALLARCLGGTVSNDAGTYVCNAWVHEVTQGSDIPTVFVHIPHEGVDADHIAAGLEQWLAAQQIEHAPVTKREDDDPTSEQPLPV